MQTSKSLPWLLTWMTSLGQAALTVYIPAFPAIARDLEMSPVDVKSTLSAFLLGYGLCQLLYGPLSDRYGRRPPLFFGLGLFVVACFANLFVHSYAQFLLCRFLQGLGAGSTITIGRSILGDVYHGPSLASAASHLSMGFAISLGVAPLIGAYLQTIFGWRADFVFLALLGASLFGLFFWKLPETARRHLHSMPWLEMLGHSVKKYGQIICDGHFWKYLLGGIFAYSIVLAWNVFSPFLIQVQYGYSSNAYGWMALLIAFAYYFAAHNNRKLVHRFQLGNIMRMASLLIAVSGLAILLGPNGLLFVLIPMSLATYSQSMIFSNTIAAALHNHADSPGYASALFSTLQMTIIALITAAMTLLPDQKYAMGGVIFALSLLIYFVLRKK